VHRALDGDKIRALARGVYVKENFFKQYNFEQPRWLFIVPIRWIGVYRSRRLFPLFKDGVNVYTGGARFRLCIAPALKAGK